HGLIARDDVLCAENIITAITIGYEPASLAHQDYAGRHVPRIDVALPVAVEPPCRDPRQIEGGRAKTAQTGNMFLHGTGFFPRHADVAAAVMWQPTGDDGIGKAFSRGNPDALVIEERALAALGNEHLVRRGVVDQPRHHRGFALERNRDSELG